MIKNIILSGGWGFSNLGDDAICMACVDLLLTKYPEAIITIETFSVEELSHIFAHNARVNIVESLYKKLYNEYTSLEEFEFLKSNSELLLKKILNKVPLLSWMKDEFTSILDDKELKHIFSNSESFIHKNELLFEDYISCCKQADLYVMGGGHFLNTWSRSLISKYFEVYLAKKYNVPCIMIGQTYGPIKSYHGKMMGKYILNNMNVISFRDTPSLDEEEVRDIDCDISVLPDLALTEKMDLPAGDFITYIPFKLSKRNYLSFCKKLSRLSVSYGRPVKILVSQLWYNAIEIATDVYLILKQLNIDVVLIIPRDIMSLQEEIADSYLVLSENLHGLILAYRAQRCIVCLNKNNKFITFMEQIKSSAIENINQLGEDENSLLYLSNKAFSEQTGNNCYRINHEQLFKDYLNLLP